MALHELESRLGELDPDADVAFLCHHGVRSLRAAALARAHGLARAVSVAGGIDLWSLSVDPSVARYRRASDGRLVPV
jgi:rhodanese-related sulfurtransferase